MWPLLAACVDDPERPRDTEEPRSTVPTLPDDDDDALLDTIDAFLLAQMQLARVPGLGAAVVAGDEVVWIGAYGQADVEAGRAVTADTPFGLASVSKTAIAVAVMQQVEAGVLDLDEDVDLVLPFAVDPPDAPGEPVTLRHLLTHTSAIHDRASVWNDLYSVGDSPIPLGGFLESYLAAGGSRNQPTNWLPTGPGRHYEYSNIGAALAAYVVEVATGVDFADGCEATIFGPMGLEHTAFRLADLDPAEVAVPYHTDDGVLWEPYDLFGYPDYPDGLLRSSAADLATYMTLFTGADGGGVLRPETVDLILTDALPAVVPDQGLVLYPTHTPVGSLWGHSGSDYGTATEFLFDPATGHGVLLLMNADLPDPSAVSAMGQLLLAAAPSLASAD